MSLISKKWIIISILFQDLYLNARMKLSKITDWVPNILEIPSIEVLFWFKKLLTDERPHHPTLSMESIWKVNFYPYFFQGCLSWRVLHSAAQHWWWKSELFSVEVLPEEPFRWWPMLSRFISPSRHWRTTPSRLNLLQDPLKPEKSRPQSISVGRGLFRTCLPRQKRHVEKRHQPLWKRARGSIPLRGAGTACGS